MSPELDTGPFVWVELGAVALAFTGMTSHPTGNTFPTTHLGA